MSKRKSRSKSLFVAKEDMVFLDDSDSEIGLKILTKGLDKSKNFKKSDVDNSGVRISARAKKQKSIYDPSENNGPVHKKKKEALEAAMLEEAKKKQQGSAKKMQKSKSTASITIKTPQDVKKKLILEKVADTKSAPSDGIIVQKVVKPSVVVKQTTSIKAKEPPQYVHLNIRKSTSSSSMNSEFEKALTVDLNNKKIPDISKWTEDNVLEYFIKEGFDKKESQIFKDQQIDGEALLILNREDLKGLNLRVGTFVKMWNHILRFQSGRNDFTQGWK